VAGGLAPAPPIGSFGGARGSARPPWLARFQHLSLCPCHHHHVSRKTAPRPALGADGGDFRRNAPSDRTDKHRQASVSCIARVPYGVPTKTPQEGPAAGRGSIFWRAVAGRPAARLAHSARIFRGGGVPSDQTINRRARPDPGFPRLDVAHLPNFDLGATGAGPAIKTTWLAPVPSDQTVNRGRTGRRAVGNCPTCPPACRRSPAIRRSTGVHVRTQDFRGSKLLTCQLAHLRNFDPLSNLSRPSDQTVNRGRTGRRAVGNCQTCPPACRRSPGFPRLEVAHLPTCSPAQLRPLSNLSRPSDQTVNRGGTGRRAVGNCPTWPAGWRRPPR
jgi:hypothetical protein